MVNSPEPDALLRQPAPERLLTGYDAAMGCLSPRNGERLPQLETTVWTRHEALLLAPDTLTMLTDLLACPVDSREQTPVPLDVRQISRDEYCPSVAGAVRDIAGARLQPWVDRWRTSSAFVPADSAAAVAVPRTGGVCPAAGDRIGVRCPDGGPRPRWRPVSSRSW
jgi:hypothetical protein